MRRERGLNKGHILNITTAQVVRIANPRLSDRTYGAGRPKYGTAANASCTDGLLAVITEKIVTMTVPMMLAPRYRHRETIR